jgi:hypothetical protein
MEAEPTVWEARDLSHDVGYDTAKNQSSNESSACVGLCIY